VTRIRILRVDRFDLDSSRLAGFGLDAPVAGQETESPLITVVGWVVGRDGPVAHVELVWPGVEIPLRHVIVDKPRPDVAQTLPHAATSGFYDCLSALGLPPRFELILQTTHPDGHVSLLAVIHAERDLSAPTTATQELLQPILVTALARSGTTWLMHLLAAHPSIAIYPRYPYEMHAAGYWWHLCRVLTQTTSFHGASHPDLFWFDLERIGAPPFPTPEFRSEPGLQDWFTNNHLRDVIRYCQSMTERFYRRIADTWPDQTDPTCLRYFAEKQVVPDYAWLAWELYPDTREIFLARDFRDVFCSILAFNRKRGVVTFGRETVGSDEEYADWLARQVENLRRNWAARSDRALLVRYEDLIRSPAAELRRILSYLKLDSGDAAVRAVLSRAGQADTHLKSHRTTDNPTESIGRWRRDLPPALQRVVNRAFAGALAAFGYA